MDDIFDRLARLVAETLGVPAACATAVHPDRIRVLGAVGLGGPWRSGGELPLAHTFCAEVVRRGRALVLADVRSAPETAGYREVQALGAVAYAGVPFGGGNGRPAGVLAAIDDRPRRWTEAELRVLGDLASLATAELRLRAGASGERGRAAIVLDAVLEAIAEGVVVADERGRLTHLSAAAERMHGHGGSDAPREEWPARYRIYRADGTTPYSADELPLARALRGLTVAPEEAIARPPGGSPLTLRAIARPIHGPGGERLGALVVMGDVTAERAVERELRRSEEEYRVLFASNPLPMWVYDVETLRILAVNDAAVASYGYSRDEFTRLTILDIRPQEDRARVRQVAADTQDRLGHSGLWRHRRKDGSVIDVDITSHPITFEGRAAKLVLALDVTDRLQAERDLLASEQRYRLAARATSDLIYDWDLDADRIEWSEAVRTVFGYGATEPGPGAAWWSERIHPDDREQTIVSRDRALEGGAETWAMRYRFRHAGGAFAIVLDRGTILRDEEGRPVRMVGAMTDVSERERSVEELRRTYETLQALVQSSPLPIIASDLDGTVTLWNPAAERVWSWTRAEAIGHANPTLPPSQLEEAVALGRRVARGERIDGYETQRLRKDGTLAPVSLSMAPLYDARGRVSGIMSIVEDVAEQRSLLDQLQQAQKMEAVGQLAGGIAHDFNNLLTAIISGAELALSGLDARDPLREDLDQILKAGHRAAGLTRQLLAFSRRQVLKPVVLSLNGVVEEMDRMLRRLIGENIHLETRLAADLWPVRADPSQIEQVILNLAVNSRDAMPGGGTLTLETANVELDAAFASRHVSVRPGPYVLLAVADTGEGMAPETRARVFEPFFTTKEPGKGTGLGLSTVYGIVKQSGGSIWVESLVGHGTQFTVYLPRAQGEPGPAAAAEPEAPASGGRETVLLVEDDQQVRRVACEILSRNGYAVLEAANGGEALLICEQQPGTIHLMVTDVVMPKMSGRQLARRLASIRPGLKVLYLSGYTGGELAAQGVLEPGTEFMAKPFTPDALARRVREVLDQ